MRFIELGGPPPLTTKRSLLEEVLSPSGNHYLHAREPWVPEHGYVLKIRPQRFAELEGDLYAHSLCSQAIPKIPTAMRRKKMLCFISTTKGSFTHLARSIVYYEAESGRDKLEIWNVTPLAAPVRISALKARLKGGQSWRARHALAGGHVSPIAFGLLMSALERVDPGAFAAAGGLIDRHTTMSEPEGGAARINWAYQRDAAITALEIAHIPKEQLKVPPQLEGGPASGATSIFDSDENMTTIEDLVILQDHEYLDDEWSAIKRQRYPVRTFVNGDTKLSVLLANKLELEKQLGVDLIYFNETMQSVVFVQYKMFAGEDGEEGYRPDAQLDVEISRMDTFAGELAKIAPDESCDGYRFAADPFFFKFCSKLLTHEDNGHAPGIYVPLSFWKLLAKDPRSKGPKGGTIVYDETFGRRRLTPTNFIDLVARGWIGTSAIQSSAIASYLKGAIHGKKGIVFAVQSTIPPAGEEDQSDARSMPALRPKKNRYPGRRLKAKVFQL